VPKRVSGRRVIRVSDRNWFAEKYETFKDDPEYVAEELVLDIVLGLQNRMKTLNLTQSELARRIGASPAFVSQVLHGRPNMTVLTLSKFLVALGLTCSLSFPAAQEEAWNGLPRSTTQSTFPVVPSPGCQTAEGETSYVRHSDTYCQEAVVTAHAEADASTDQESLSGGLSRYDLPAAAS